MKKAKPPRLVLSKITLRTLSAEDLTVVGGQDLTLGAFCPEHVPATEECAWGSDRPHLTRWDTGIL